MELCKYCGVKNDDVTECPSCGELLCPICGKWVFDGYEGVCEKCAIYGYSPAHDTDCGGIK